MFAVPAKPGVRTVEQPDGTTIDVVLRGDEQCHYYTTADGYMLTQVGQRFYYATVDEATGLVINSQRPAADADKRSAADRAFLEQHPAEAAIKAFVSEATARGVSRTPAANKAPRQAPLQAGAEDGYTKGPGLFPGASVPTTGDQRCCIVLVEYQDVSFKLDDPHAYFTDLLNKEGFDEYGATGSARDFFIASSDGIYRPTFDVYGPVKLPYKRSYYGGNSWNGNDKQPELMVVDALNLLDSTVEFSQYDSDNDGEIDFVYIFYAGFGEADGGPSESVWPHTWSLSEAGETKYYDGKLANNYACSHEWTNGSYTSGLPSGIGTFSHEYGHVLGLPDLYPTNYASVFDPGDWTIMCSGSYNNDQRTPPTYTAFERYALGWIEPLQITGAMNGLLTPMSDEPKAYVIPTPKSNEYFILENRQQNKWDTYIPGHGMLVWHIDYNESVWKSNNVNNTSSHQYVDIEEADNDKRESTRAADSFPGTKNITSFTDTTTPNMKTWSGTALNLPITDIAEQGGVVTFKVAGGVMDVPTTTIHPEAVATTPSSITAAWDAVEMATNYRATLTTLTQSGGTAVVSGYNNLNVGNVTEYTFAGLAPSTTYTLSVKVEHAGTLSEASTAVDFTTAAPAYSDLAIELLDADNVTNSSFEANWNALDGSHHYILDVYEKEVSAGDVQTVDFTGGITGMPSGWSTNSNSTYSSKDYSGESAPSLKLSTDGAYLQSPTYPDDITEFSFWYRGATANEANSVKVEAFVNSQWVELATFTPLNPAPGATMSYTDLDPGTRAVRISYNKPSSGNVAIDDIKVTHGGAVTLIPAGDYTEYPVGAETMYRVDGLRPNTSYFYTVTGENHEGLRSLPSVEGKVTTKDVEGIEIIDAEEVSASDASTLRLYDLQGRTATEFQHGRVYIELTADGARKVIIR